MDSLPTVLFLIRPMRPSVLRIGDFPYRRTGLVAVGSESGASIAGTVREPEGCLMRRNRPAECASTRVGA